MAEKLKEPRKKWRSGQRAGCPLPVLVESVSGIPAHLAVWKTYHGLFTGDSVEVHDPEDMTALYNMGFFGKGSFSRSCPRLARKTIFPEIIRERQWKQRLEWQKQQESVCSLRDKGTSSSHVLQKPVASNEDSPDVSLSEDINVSISQCQSQNTKEENTTVIKNVTSDTSVIVVADTVPHCEGFLSQLKPRLEHNPDTSREVLLLSLEEAVFLNYALGCLLVQDILGGRELSSVELWSSCQEADPHFIERYVVYHYFRSQNWVVKSGLKYGGDFLLYKEGPGMYHASYIVLVKVMQKEPNRGTETSMNWTTLMGLNRLAETSGKEIIICHVIWPSDVPYTLLPSPNVISKFKVHEVVVKRWQSSVARIVSDGENRKDNSFDE